MNRRSFVSRLGAALAVAPVVGAVQKDRLFINNEPVEKLNALVPAGVSSQICQGEDARDCGPTQYNQHEPKVRPEDQPGYRWAVLRSRGLIEPCPNCHVDAWSWPYGLKDPVEQITCGRCGWLDHRARFERRCPCADCSWLMMGLSSYARIAGDNWVRARRSALLASSPVGFYVVLDDHSLDVVRRVERNVYDPSTDGWLHNVEQQQIARVLCSVYLLNNPKDRSGIEQVRRPNGDLVCFHWETLDCYEWQQECARVRPTVVMCVCDDWLTCEHPYPITLPPPGVQLPAWMAKVEIAAAIKERA